jgi:2-dehydropantoate 2-reductase
MNIAVIGTGGVGGYFGGRLALAGNNVTFLARGKHLEALLSKGLQVKSIKGGFIINPVQATDHIDRMPVADLIIIGLKAWQISEIAPQLKSIMHAETVILPLENGVTAAEDLIEILGNKNVVGGLCRIFSKIESPGIIAHLGVEPTIAFGEIDGKITPRTQKIKSILEYAGIGVKLTSNIQSEIWMKFIFICSSGLLAVTRSPYNEIMATPQTRDMLQQLFEEIVNLANAKNIEINKDFVSKNMKYIDAYPPNTTSSMARDIWEGKPSELEYQNGMVVKMADEIGIDVPINRFIYYCLLPMEKRARMAK